MLLIRDYEPQDLDAVVRLNNETMHRTGLFNTHGLREVDLLDIEGAYLNNGGAFLVGEADSILAVIGAFRKWSGGHGFAELKRIRVLPSQQGRGYGRAILIALEQRAREMGYRGAWLDTAVQLSPARKLYESHGYVATGSTRVDGIDCVIYEKSFE